jgi:hypothetical protein
VRGRRDLRGEVQKFVIGVGAALDAVLGHDGSPTRPAEYNTGMSYRMIFRRIRT